MPKTTAFATAVIAKVLNDTDFSWDANTDLYLSLHTSAPGVGGSQTTNECAYTSYARVTVARDATGWDVAAGVGSNDDLLQFPEATGGSETITHVGVGTASSGAGNLLVYGALGSSRSVSDGIQPQINANQLTWTEA